MIVVDASVAVKWLFPEPGEALARRLLESGERLSAPGLIRVEVAAAIARKVRLNEIEPKEAEAAIRLWFRSLAEGLIALTPDEEDLEAAFRLAIELKHPLQDCLYLALAERLNAGLITADDLFFGRACQRHPRVRLLTSLA